MMPAHLQDYLPLLPLAFWFIYKTWRSRQVRSKLPELLARGAILIDVRSPAEYAGAHAPGSVNMPLNNLTERLTELPSSVPLVLACASGTRSAMAARQLQKMGFKEIYNIGSWRHFLH